jgi:Zn-dependent oligopeptidase
MQHVTEALLSLYQSILGLRFEEIDATQSRAWHADVRMFGVSDAESGEFMGAFYLDLYPRYVSVSLSLSLEATPLVSLHACQRG